MEKINPLTQEQLNSLSQETDRKNKPARFVALRKAVNFCTGDLTGGNVIYQPVYWDRPKSFLNMVKGFLEENNPDVAVRIVYSD